MPSSEIIGLRHSLLCLAGLCGADGMRHTTRRDAT